MINDDIKDLRIAVRKDLFTFACVVEPNRMYGDVHRKLFNWWQAKERKDFTLCLIPRDHQKSHCAAIYTSWLILNNPAITIIYISSTSTLAERQLREIKQVLTNPQFRAICPEMVNKEVSKREKWTNSGIIVDHPSREEAGVRDDTIFACGLTTQIVGLHCQVMIKDDVVVNDNAYIQTERDKTEERDAYLSSVQTTGAREIVVGTRYHPDDLYGKFLEMELETFEEGVTEPIGSEKLYDVFEEVVEVNGEFLWPRSFSDSGKEVYGFDRKQLAIKKAKYSNKMDQFYSQYYNDPNAIGNQKMDQSRFQYYNRELLRRIDGKWTVGKNKEKLNVYAAMDFAFSEGHKSDWTVILVIGIDRMNRIYVLDIDRFKTDKMDVYFKAVIKMHSKWQFRRLRAEVTVAQKVIAVDLKQRAKDEGLNLVIDEHRPSKKDGSKQERIDSVLSHRYENMTIYHYRGGHTLALEQELLSPRPQHDDIKDALASVVETAQAPGHSNNGIIGTNNPVSHIKYHPKYGGVLRG